MITLYLLFFAMTVIALSLLAIPFFKFKSVSKFIILSLIFILFLSGIFLITGNTHNLSSWLTDGEKHYELLTQVDELGGVKGLIEQIKVKIRQHPEDAQGWFILGKLYYSQHDTAQAKDALIKAHELDKNNVEIKKYLDKM
ncbi:MAG: hypothetical protein P4M12_09270 [Gammaproteobacteria bacterium]|nr:hypothetical protein [Gammaproteobacteria bacterium]